MRQNQLKFKSFFFNMLGVQTGKRDTKGSILNKLSSTNFGTPESHLLSLKIMRHDNFLRRPEYLFYLH